MHSNCCITLKIFSNSTYFRSDISLSRKLIIEDVKIKLEKTVNSPAMPATKNRNIYVKIQLQRPFSISFGAINWVTEKYQRNLAALLRKYFICFIVY